VDVPNGRGGQRLADVSATTLVAFMFPGRPVVCPRPARVAAVTAAPQLSVVSVERCAVEPADLEVTEHRAYALVDVAGIGLAAAFTDIQDVEVLVHELVDGGFCPRVSTFVHLVEQPRSDLLCLGFGFGTRWN
jgi:hypothetical protein